MNQLMAGNAVTMSSIEISALVDKRHDNVKRTIEALVDKGVIASPQIEEKPTAGRPTTVYLFTGEKGKRDSIIVVAQLSPEFTARLVDRWNELEAAQLPAIPKSFSDALRLAADLQEQKEHLSQELALAAPKVEFVDRYCTANGSMSFRQVAKLLQAKETEFRLFLIENDIMYRLGGTLTPMAQHIAAGRFEVKTGTSLASNHAFSQARFTAKGVRWIGGLWTEYKAGSNAA
ncbi:phage antirepressor KilAC domain-containing protein [Klebsiella oxytoca]|uniref:Phage regulatory protein/antirepressor Ant n=1 Tax=Klebsiella oxytoca TaxID=571 RepID=A0AAD3YRT5_KLEOX|nr:DNA-binding protein [Klebsiella oxytoca]MBL6088510.1 phage antirepressor KilAC domain-containing protein [Klebsiella oxytoca]MBL6253137.1 phage antirepressor KilAC domain-containing protein [Klebsiella oxytoca]MBL6274524.1 phage antirepressor KilAC domain-containing protein [Klebsiella oxytoca]MDU2890041.1 phage antirepressor KilAC domain-containing protein [Klebsiella oxytoca]MEC6026026.1 phage antirepressor KilAC domain-containing protein [Klebsiella oxytoca]